MNEDTIDLLIKIFTLIFGLILTIFHKKLGNKAVYERQKFLSFIPPKIKVDKKMIIGFQYGYFFMGLLFTVLSLLAIFNIIN